MTAVHLRDRDQITLPSEVVQAADLAANDLLEVSYINGIVQLTPLKNSARRADMSRFVGVAGASYGTDTETMNQYLRDQRNN